MNCPSCNYATVRASGGKAKVSSYCIRCGFPVREKGPFWAAFRGILTWVVRRGLAGFITGLVAWWVILASEWASGEFLFRAVALTLSGALGGLFLGAVEGMMEDSTIKALRGGLIGGVGGLFGALLGAGVLQGRDSTEIQLAALMITWGTAGAFIGAVPGWLERQKSRVGVGALAGAMGGAIGIWLGDQVFTSMTELLHPQTWIFKRFCEGMTGASLGAYLWLVIGLAEMLYIFKRRRLSQGDHKECDRCHHANPLNAWYCGECGSVLQVAALPEHLGLPKRLALARVVSACQVLARLVATTTIVVSYLAAFFIGTYNLCLGLLAFILAILVGYVLYILVSALAELLSPAAV